MLTNLNPYVVGLHYFASVVLVALSAVLVSRVYADARPARARRAALVRGHVTHVTSALVLVTVVVGILVTGSGPHAGDGGAARNGLNPEFMQHVHSWPAYALLALHARPGRRCRRALPRPCACGSGPGFSSRSRSLQIVVGLWQARTGLPIVLVNIHMVLAVLLVAAMTAVVMHLTEPAGFTQEGPAYAGSIESAPAPR